MDWKNRRSRPRLERRNAAKRIEYDALAASSSLDGSYRSLHTRWLKFPDRTSFRIEGIDGEVDRICLSLGLSGPDDFAIPEAAYESKKVRLSSDRLPCSRLLRLASPKVEEVKEDEDSEAEAELCERVRESVKVRDWTELSRNKIAEPSGNGIFSGRNGGGGGGIKGVRPPVLKPPPSMRLPVCEHTCSTWDILSDYTSYEEVRSSKFVEARTGSPSEGDNDDADESEVDEAVVEQEEEGITGRLHDSLLEQSNSPSFSTSNDDDSSGTILEPFISPTRKLKRTISNWEKGDLLGRGSFGSVYEGISGDGTFFAIKEVSLLDHDNQGRQSIFQLQQEIALLSHFEHKNVVQYYGTEKNESQLFIFLELMEKGSLVKLYQRYNLKDSQVSAYTRQILCGLKYLHDQNVVHRDIKCSNILVDASGAVKLADFGLAKATKMNDIKSCKGTAFWMAPEVVNGKNQGYGHPADIWSLGCTVLEMLTRKFPYSEFGCHMAALYRIGSGQRPSVPDSLSTDAHDFIIQCLQANPHDRPTAAQLLEHPFVKRALPTSSWPPSTYSSGRRR